MTDEIKPDPQRTPLSVAYREVATFFDEDTRAAAQDWAIEMLLSLGFRPDDRDRTGQPVDNDVQTLLAMLAMKVPSIVTFVDPLRLRAFKN